ncbi:CaiB/BaiF CoA transferase family protein [Hamadaea tsunoensis]|uniref:CaiB/BaiF CoA transferase family protein n=1 Tax=Hamadaea tsunoensis TaxID=53368 RepID=UPI000423FF41|nr:CoA transferase [Hamadaea tsunoensis]
MRQGPLSGVRLLDLTNVLAGPYCTYQLMLLGAEVVKIEVPGQGDLARRLGADPDLNDLGLGASFLAQNAGKKSIELNLKEESGRDSFTELVRHADVLVENFRPGVLARLGFDWDRLRELNPRLVYCAISGFGQTGPLSQAPAYDQIIQGMSGMMSITGTADTAPQRVGFPVCDTIGGLTAALAVAAAIAGRERTGEGCFIDVSMLEASLSTMGWPLSNYLVAGVAPLPMGDQNATAAPSGTFETADGPLNIAANQQRQFESLCHVVGRPDLITDPRFERALGRKNNRDELNRELNKALSAHGALHWEQALTAAGVPAARILTVAEAVELPHLTDREFFLDLPFPEPAESGVAARLVRVSGSGILIDGHRGHPAGPPPLLGEHNEQVSDLISAWTAEQENR